MFARTVTSAIVVCVAGLASAQTVPQIYGHRGTGESRGNNPLPENTIPSVLEAVEEGADVVEIDVQLSSDGQVVVMHDETVDRTTDGIGCVGDLSLSELQALDAARGTPLAGTGVTVPTLTEVLTATSAPINVEIKVSSGGSCPATDAATLAAGVAAALAANPGDHVVSSFDLDMLGRIGAEDSNIPRILETINPDDRQTAVDNGLFGVSILSLTIRSQEAAAAFQDAGLFLNVWTVNDADSIDELAGYGVDAITTDEPDVAAMALADGFGGGDDGESGGCSAAPGAGTGLGLWFFLASLVALRRREK